MQKATMKNKLKYGRAVRITDPLEMVGFIRTNKTNCQFVSLLTVTEVKLKVSCPHKNVVKVSRRNGLINMNYNMAVRRRIAENLNVPLSDAKYENGETWFIHETDEAGKALPLVHHKAKDDGKFYLQYFPIRSSQTKYFGEKGEEIPESTLKPFFYAKKEQDDFKPVTCVFNVANIREMRAARVIVKDDLADETQSILSH